MNLGRALSLLIRSIHMALSSTRLPPLASRFVPRLVAALFGHALHLGVRPAWTIRVGVAGKAGVVERACQAVRGTIGAADM